MPKMNPTISVIMSVYNGERYLKDSIESILNQSFSDFEFIIINDGSTDNSNNIIIEYSKSDSRIVFVNQKNIGLTKSLNKGLKIAKGEYIARQDSDDISDEKRFENQINFLIKGYDICCCRHFIINYNKISPGFGFYLWKPLLLLKNTIIHGTMMINKRKLIELGGYDDNFIYSQDYKLIIDFINNGCKVKYLKNVYYNSNKDSDSISIAKSKEQKKYKEIARSYLKISKLFNV